MSKAGRWCESVLCVLNKNTTDHDELLGRILLDATSVEITPAEYGNLKKAYPNLQKFIGFRFCDDSKLLVATQKDPIAETIFSATEVEEERE